MGADGRIDKRLYPNFARLAGDADLVPRHRLGRPGHALRRARDPRRAAAAPGPAAGGGGPPREHLQPVRRALPAARERGRDRAVRAEPVHGANRPSFEPRMRSLWDDLGLVYAHEVLPDDLERELPSVTETWATSTAGSTTGSAVADTRLVKRETKRQRFVRIHQNLAQGRPGRFEEFVDGIEGGRHAAPAPDPHPAAARAVPVPALGALLPAHAEGGAHRAATGGPGTAARSWSSRPTSATCCSCRPPTGCSASCSTACTRWASTTAPWSLSSPTTG